MTQTMNGNTRKSLADQIDRLDTILDGLADSLSGAVADAVCETVGKAVQVAVQTVLTELLNNPAVQERLRNRNDPSADAPTAKADRAATLVNSVSSLAAAGWTNVRRACVATVQGVVHAATTTRRHARLAWAYRMPLLAAAAFGMTLGAAAFFAGPWVAATAGWVAGFTAATAAQLTMSVRRLAASLATNDRQP